MKFLVAILSITLFSCQQKVPEDFDTIIYSFQDASVAPTYHRSYKIILTATNAKFKVHSYSTTLVDTTFTLHSDAFVNIKKQIKSIGDFGDLSTCKSCTGSTHTSFNLYLNNKETFNLRWNSAELTPEFEAINKQIKYTIPNFKKLLETPLPTE